MVRNQIDCRDHPEGWGTDCSIQIFSDSAEEIIEAAVQHAAALHGHPNIEALRSEVRGRIEGPASDTET